MRIEHSILQMVALVLPLVSCTMQPDLSEGLVPLESDVVAFSADAPSSSANDDTEVSPVKRAQASEAQLSLDEAVSIALAWHPAIDEAAGNLRQRIEEIAVARAGYLPQVSAGIGPSYDSSSENMRTEENSIAGHPITA